MTSQVEGNEVSFQPKETSSLRSQVYDDSDGDECVRTRTRWRDDGDGEVETSGKREAAGEVVWQDERAMMKRAWKKGATGVRLTPPNSASKKIMSLVAVPKRPLTWPPLALLARQLSIDVVVRKKFYVDRRPRAALQGASAEHQAMLQKFSVKGKRRIEVVQVRTPGADQPVSHPPRLRNPDTTPTLGLLPQNRSQSG
ncbi:hypothetical protein F5148DRAFT_1145928 [Russula earlei]|uniref:Uncharacterized protein n=1 Tax=Russula earlei TaxID=71964 RepID=A0ACC0UME9_9AGAM|nr:hypothetical protein F5148DRAFT_1145928 [Russula earlei]